MMQRAIIGVVCNAGEEPWVREFFELFKTPWEFHRTGREYSVVLSTDANLATPQAKLYVLYSSSEAGPAPQKATAHETTYLVYRDFVFPIYGRVATFESDAAVPLYVQGGAAAAAVDTSSAGTKVVRVGYDLFQEVRLLLTSGQPAHNALTPTLEIHIAMLRDWILGSGVPFIEIPAAPAGYEFVACLTHDVDFIRIRDHKFDHTMLGFMYRASIGSLLKLVKRRISWRDCLRNLKAFVSLPAVHLGLCRDFWHEDFARFSSLERDLKATFFFIPFKNRPGDKVYRPYAKRRSALYDVTKERALIQQLSRMGNEIGVHGIDAWHDPEKGREEQRRLREITGSSDIGIRVHWLCFDTSSPRLLDEAGYQYDSTVGYNETVGYKAGTTQVFRPEGAAALLELPLHMQDTALFYNAYLDLGESSAWKLSEILLKNATAYGGVLTILWHTRSLAPDRLWGAFYSRLLDTLRARPVWFATAAQAVDWFRYRRAVSFRNADFSNGCLRLAMDQDSGAHCANDRPNLTIRIHIPPAASDTDRRGDRSFFDIPWTGEPVMNIAVR